MSRISDTLRQQVTERAQGLCEYCQTAQIIVVTMEVDHIIPVSASGQTSLENLCLMCRGCNSFKHDIQKGLDPDTGEQVDLFNPRKQKWSDHFSWNEDATLIIGLTATGRATINQLRMNRPAVVDSRQIWVHAGWHPPRTNQFPSQLGRN